MNSDPGGEKPQGVISERVHRHYARGRDVVYLAIGGFTDGLSRTMRFGFFNLDDDILLFSARIVWEDA
jgi:hypothetical protein